MSRTDPGQMLNPAEGQVAIAAASIDAIDARPFPERRLYVDEVVRDRHRPVCPFDARYETGFVPGCNRSKALQKLDEIRLLPLSQS
jgi:hypothetical protein